MGKKILGTSKVSSGRKISLLKTIADKMKIKIGDEVVYFEDNGRFLIEKA